MNTLEIKINDILIITSHDVEIADTQSSYLTAILNSRCLKSTLQNERRITRKPVEFIPWLPRDEPKCHLDDPQVHHIFDLRYVNGKKIRSNIILP